MCYERRRAEACVDESAHHALGTREEPGTLTQGAPVFPGSVCVYYCRTYYKAVRGGGGGEWRTCVDMCYEESALCEPLQFYVSPNTLNPETHREHPAAKQCGALPDLHLGWVSSSRVLQLRPGQRATGYDGCEGGHRTDHTQGRRRHLHRRRGCRHACLHPRRTHRHRNHKETPRRAQRPPAQ